MFNYYRFIGSKYSAVQQNIEEQAAADKLTIHLISNFGEGQNDSNRITVIVKHDVIIDIYRG